MTENNTGIILRTAVTIVAIALALIGLVPQLGEFSLFFGGRRSRTGWRISSAYFLSRTHPIFSWISFLNYLLCLHAIYVSG